MVIGFERIPQDPSGALSMNIFLDVRVRAVINAEG
jgi:hypothetical protein